MTILIDESFDHVSIEGLRIAYSSCFSCGVCWFEEHVSLDCRECGGYALVRPCPSCDGRCGNKWTRNLQASHARQQAIWDGCCGREVTPTPVENILDIKRRSLPNVVMSSPVSNNSSSTTTATGNLTTSQSSAATKPILLAKQQSVVSVSWLTSIFNIYPFGGFLIAVDYYLHCLGHEWYEMDFFSRQSCSWQSVSTQPALHITRSSPFGDTHIIIPLHFTLHADIQTIPFLMKST